MMHGPINIRLVRNISVLLDLPKLDFENFQDFQDHVKSISGGYVSSRSDCSSSPRCESDLRYSGDDTQRRLLVC